LIEIRKGRALDGVRTPGEGFGELSLDEGEPHTFTDPDEELRPLVDEARVALRKSDRGLGSLVSGFRPRAALLRQP